MAEKDLQKIILNAVQCKGCNTVYPQGYEGPCSFCDSKDGLKSFFVTQGAVSKHIVDAHETIYRILKISETLKEEIKNKESELEKTKKTHQEICQTHKRYISESQKTIRQQESEIKSSNNLRITLEKDVERLLKEKGESDRRIKENHDLNEKYKNSKEAAIEKFKDEIKELRNMNCQMKTIEEKQKKNLLEGCASLSKIITLKEKAETDLERITLAQQKTQTELDSVKTKIKQSEKMTRKLEEKNRILFEQNTEHEQNLSSLSDENKAVQAKLDQANKENIEVKEKFESFQEDYRKLKNGVQEEANLADKIDLENKLKIVNENIALKENLKKISESLALERKENQACAEKLEKSQESIEITGESFSERKEELTEISNLVKEKETLMKELIEKRKKEKTHFRINIGLGVGVVLMVLTLFSRRKESIFSV